MSFNNNPEDDHEAAEAEAAYNDEYGGPNDDEDDDEDDYDDRMMEEDDEDDDEESSPALELLLAELRTIAAASGDCCVADAVCRKRARNVLEATAGNVFTATQLYWDDFLVRRQQAAAAAADAEPLRMPRQRRHRRTDVALDRHPRQIRRARDLEELEHESDCEEEDEEEEESDHSDGRAEDDDDYNHAAAADAVQAAADAVQAAAQQLQQQPEQPQPQQQQRAIADHSEDDDEPPPAIAGGDPSIAVELRRRLFNNEAAVRPLPPAAAAAAYAEVELLQALLLRRRGVDQQPPAPQDRNLNHHHRRREDDQDDDDGEVDEEEEESHEHPPRRARAMMVVGGGGGRESVSVSDDEGALRGLNRRLLARLAAGDGDRCDDGKRTSAKRRKLQQQLDSIQEGQEEKCEEEEDDGYLSDNDWLWESLDARGSIPLSNPVDLLWGCAANRKKKEKKEPLTLMEVDGGGAAKDLTARSAMIASDEADGADDDDDDKEEEDESPKGIPRTWLNAGFHVASMKDEETTTVFGLGARPPNEDDLAYFCWKHQQDNDNRHATIPPPYHCRAVTALLSVITGLVYTGAQLQSDGQVSCVSSRQPFLELVQQEVVNKEKEAKKKTKVDDKVKKVNETSDQFLRECEARLADALSALLFIAAKASVERKQKALQSLRVSKDPADQRKWQRLQRKLRLVPTCWWDKDPSGDVRLPELADDGITCNIQVATSYTNIEDLRSYVLGNMRSFTSSGGCALFLETIMRVHGKGAVTRMIRRARKNAGCGVTDMTAPLIHCTCDARQIAKLDADPKLSQKLRADTKNRVVLDTTPTGHDCLSIELLSLLLTGRVYSSLQGWSTAPLCLGILSDKSGEVGRGLTRPDKPVWIMRGPTCYSVMWLNGSNDHAATFSSVDRSGAVAAFTHCNTWYGERNLTKLRLVTDRSERSHPLQAVSDDEDAAFEKEISTLTLTLQMLARRRRARQVSAIDCVRAETVDPELIVTKEEMDRVEANAEDQKFYPGRHRMWSYDMGEDPKQAADGDCKQRARAWKSFFSLTDREKLVVETKLGPKINTILWTRWPRATVDRFLPDDPPAIV